MQFFSRLQQSEMHKHKEMTLIFPTFIKGEYFYSFLVLSDLQHCCLLLLSELYRVFNQQENTFEEGVGTGLNSQHFILMTYYVTCLQNPYTITNTGSLRPRRMSTIVYVGVQIWTLLELSVQFK